MALADALSRNRKAHHQRQLICAALKFTLSGSYTKEDIEAYTKALDIVDPLDPIFIPSSRITAALREEGVQISSSSIERHRKQSCSCYRTAV